MELALIGLLITIFAIPFVPTKDTDDDFPIGWVQ